MHTRTTRTTSSGWRRRTPTGRGRATAEVTSSSSSRTRTCLSGYDPEGEQCRGGQPEFLHFYAGRQQRRGHHGHVGRAGRAVPLHRQRAPVAVRARGGDLLDNVPIQQCITHYYGMAAGEYDVLRVCSSARQQPDGDRPRGQRGRDVGARADRQPALRRRQLPHVGEAHGVPRAHQHVRRSRREWFCTTAGEGGRYTLALEAAPVFDPSGARRGNYPDGGKQGAPDRLDFNPGGRDNQLRGAATTSRYSTRSRRVRSASARCAPAASTTGSGATSRS